MYLRRGYMCTPRYKDTDWFKRRGQAKQLAVGEGLADREQASRTRSFRTSACACGVRGEGGEKRPRVAQFHPATPPKTTLYSLFGEAETLTNYVKAPSFFGKLGDPQPATAWKNQWLGVDGLDGGLREGMMKFGVSCWLLPLTMGWVVMSFTLSCRNLMLFRYVKDFYFLFD